MILFDDDYIREAYGRERFAEGSDQTAVLAALLVKDGRLDAVIRASMDKEYRKQLIYEYHLS